MTWTKAFLLLPAAALVTAISSSARSGADSAPELALAAAATRAGAADPRVDSARAELAAGRAWHAATLLRAAAAAGVVLTPEDIVDLARADTGWRNWPGVVDQLNGKPWLDQTANGEGWLLLARAREEQRSWAAAAEAYDRYFATPAGRDNRVAAGLRARHAKVLALAGRERDAAAALDRAASVPVVVSWATLDPAAVAADSGRVDQVRVLLERVTDSVARVYAWELVPRALLASGDSAAAERAYRDAVGGAQGEARKARAWSIIGDIARARGDQAAAREAWLSSVRAGGITPGAANVSAQPPGAARSARRLLEMGGLSADQALLVAQALDRANDDANALKAYDLHVQALGGAQAAEGVRLDRARILVATPGRETEAAQEFQALSTSTRERVGAPALELWARLRNKQGRTADEATLRQRLIERFPTSAEAADVVFFRGDARHDENNLAAALAEYDKLAKMAPAQDRAGLATMRSAQIHLLNKEPARAVAIYEGYLAGFPTGRRWQEASYWAARIRLGMGERDKARALIDRLRKDDPFSYYTIQAAKLLGEEFTLDLPPGEAPEAPAWLTQGVSRLDQLMAGGLMTGASAEIDRLTAQARAGGLPALQSLAEELIRRDYPIQGINLGFEARRQGAPWTLRLAKIVYPWSYRDVFMREAKEDGVDPFLTAALARQESAFDPDARSVANAVGLMQMLPSTGAETARKVGPREFREELLEVPDVNVHLGTLHLKDLLESNKGDITRFLAGYNAGQHRVVRWVNFAEAGDPLTFTERIPFAETRDYVKQIQRNLVLYRLLYGQG